MNIERRRRQINELVDTALSQLEGAGHFCDHLNCVCQGQFAGCPLRNEDDTDSDLDVNVSSDEGYER